MTDNDNFKTWTVRNVSPQTIADVKRVANQSGMKIGAWVNKILLEAANRDLSGNPLARDIRHATEGLNSAPMTQHKPDTLIERLEDAGAYLLAAYAEQVSDKEFEWRDENKRAAYFGTQEAISQLNKSQWVKIEDAPPEWMNGRLLFAMESEAMFFDVRYKKSREGDMDYVSAIYGTINADYLRLPPQPPKG